MDTKSNKNKEIKSGIFDNVKKDSSNSSIFSNKSNQNKDNTFGVFGANKEKITISNNNIPQNPHLFVSKNPIKNNQANHDNSSSNNDFYTSSSSTNLLKKYMQIQKTDDLQTKQKNKNDHQEYNAKISNADNTNENKEQNIQNQDAISNLHNLTTTSETTKVKNNNNNDDHANNNKNKKINKIDLLKNLVQQTKTESKQKENLQSKQRWSKQDLKKDYQEKDGDRTLESLLTVSAEIGNSDNNINIESFKISTTNEEEDLEVETKKGTNRDNTQINKILNQFEYEEFDGDVSELIKGKELRAMMESKRDDIPSFNEYDDKTVEYATETDKKKGSNKSKFKSFKKSNFKNVQKTQIVQPSFIKKIAIVYDAISIISLAKQISVKTKDIEKILVSLGIDADDDYLIDFDTAEIVVTELGHDIKKATKIDEISDEYEDHKKQLITCNPVVAIMGHVDHGKTTLLDVIRKSDIASREHGGITQSIGAYKVSLNNNQEITFLDTPGHEAFSKMRMRGANATNVLVLVVAADDGIMQQTIEAINHAKAANVPVVVAINKIDNPGADITKVKNELLKYELVTEDFGGDVMAVPISAKLNQNIDKLLEAILLQSEVLDLKSDLAAKPSGVIIEANIDKQKGIVCSVILQNGTLKRGDIIVAGESFGKIRQMIDDKGIEHQSIIPQTPVKIYGFSSVPKAGDKFFFAKNEKIAKQFTEYKKYKALNHKKIDRSVLFENSKKKQINLIIKSDNQGSSEAISNFVEQLKLPDDVFVKIIHSSLGNINESDILLAKTNNAFIFGFNIKIETKCELDIKKYNVVAKTYNVIYQMFDEINSIIESKKEKVKIYTKIGTAEIREIFNISGRGKIAGCMVLDGIVKQKSVVKVVRNNSIIHEGQIVNLRRLKENATEVNQGFECGIQIQDFEDLQKSDKIEVYEVS